MGYDAFGFIILLGTACFSRSAPHHCYIIIQCSFKSVRVCVLARAGGWGDMACATGYS